MPDLDSSPSPFPRAGVADAIEIEASVIGAGLGIEPSLVQAGMGDGRITTLCERGTGEHLGLYRATFYFGKRRFRIVIDASGSVLEGS